MEFRFFTLDVFTDRPFGGNQLAVFPEADRLPERLLQEIAREFNLSETVFVLKPRKEGALRRLRIFTPTQELPFAGHPTVGSAVLLAELGLVTFAGEYAGFALEEEVGLVRVRVRRRIGTPSFAQLSVAQLPEAGPPAPSRADLARALGLREDDLAPEPDRPEGWSCGVPYLFVPVKNREALGRIRVDTGEWERVLRPWWTPDVFIFCREGELAGSDLRGRMFAPGVSIAEDPATGSAAVALAGYLAARSNLASGTLRWTLEQGFEMGRPSILLVECDREGGKVKAVRVGGSAVSVFEGVYRLP